MGHPRTPGVLDQVSHASATRPGGVQVSPRDITRRRRVEPTEPQPPRGSLPLICNHCLPGGAEGAWRPPTWPARSVSEGRALLDLGSGQGWRRRPGPARGLVRRAHTIDIFQPPHGPRRGSRTFAFFFSFLAPYKRTKPGSWGGPSVNRKHMFLREGLFLSWFLLPPTKASLGLLASRAGRPATQG